MIEGEVGEPARCHCLDGYWVCGCHGIPWTCLDRFYSHTNGVYPSFLRAELDCRKLDRLPEFKVIA